MAAFQGLAEAGMRLPIAGLSDISRGAHFPAPTDARGPYKPYRTAKGYAVTDAALKKFLVLYLAPASVLADWAKVDPEVRKPAEEKMREDWGKWYGDHGKSVTLTEAGGRTQRITASGVSDTKNDIMLYAFVEAESHEAATKMFETHPHLGIPQSSIEVMEVRPMGPL
jgi:hypothetical protein